MNAFDRFSQSAAEDGQASKRINWQEATILNMADKVMLMIEEMRTFNSDSFNDGYMTDALANIRALKESIEA